MTASLQPAFQKKHRPAKSLGRGLRSLVTSEQQHHHHRHHRSSSKVHLEESPIEFLSSRTSTGLSFEEDTVSVLSSGTALTSSNWDVVEELPVRWATDFVPLAPSTSKQGSLDISCFELHQTGGYEGRTGTSLLTVASKSTILLYEASKGERVFRFVRVGLDS